MASFPSRRKGVEDGVDNGAASGSSKRLAQPKSLSKHQAKAGTSPRLTPLRKQASHSVMEATPFSPTHVSPTDERPRLQGQFEIRSSHSSQSLHAAFTGMSLYRSHQLHQPHEYESADRSPDKRSMGSQSESSTRISSLESYRKLSSSPPRIASPKINLPFIQTTFEDSRPTTSRRPVSTLHDTPTSSLVHSRAVHGSFVTPKTSLSVHHDSPGTSTTLTTPSSIGLHQAFHFSPSRRYSDLFSRSPATSFADSSDFQHSFTTKSEFEELPNGKGEEPSSYQEVWQKNASLPGFRDHITVITPSMLWNRLMHCTSISNEGLASLYKPSETSDEHSMDSPRSSSSEFLNDALNLDNKEEGPVWRGGRLSRQETVRQNTKQQQQQQQQPNSADFNLLESVEINGGQDELGGFRSFQHSVKAGSVLPTSFPSSKGRDLDWWETGNVRPTTVGAARSDLPSTSGKGSDDTASALLTATPLHVQEQQRGYRQSSAFEEQGADQILLLYVTTGQRELPSQIASTLNRTGAIHIDLPKSIVLQCLQQRSESASTFANLEPYLVGDMSKRRFSDLCMRDTPADLFVESEEKGKSYWHRDVVLVDQQEELSNVPNGLLATELEWGSLTAQDKATKDSVTVQLLAQVVRELGNKDGLGRGVFVLEGGISGIQAMYNGERTNAKIARDVKLPQVSRLSASPEGGATLAAMQLSESPDRIEGGSERTSLLSIPTSASRINPATAPQTLGTTRPGRPVLARLNTSESVKRATGDVAIDAARKLSISTSSLAVNPSVGAARSATLSEGFIPKPNLTPLHARVVYKDEDRSMSPERTISIGTSEPRHTPLHISTLPASTTSSTSFEPSEILSGFLYLGPDITTSSELEYLKKAWGIKRIINAANEVEDGGGEHLNLNNVKSSGIERYRKIAMRDTVEAKGVQEDIEEACAFIDDAKLHSAPVYVHCKAGKSRSVLLVMAYLIHANRWTLPKAYSYVVDRRRTVSPNIGFVAELMTFEQRRLDPKRNAASTRTVSNENEGQVVPLNKWSNRESLPTSTSIHPVTLSFWDHLANTQELKQEGLVDKRTHNTSAGQQGKGGVDRFDESALPLGVTSLKEYRGFDGRYQARRPPADERLQAPTWRASIAAIDTEHSFGSVAYPFKGDL